MARGTLLNWNDERGYGFLTHSDDEEVFVHVTAFVAAGIPDLRIGDVFNYDIEDGRRGLNARNPVVVVRGDGRKHVLRAVPPTAATAARRAAEALFC